MPSPALLSASRATRPLRSALLALLVWVPLGLAVGPALATAQQPEAEPSPADSQDVALAAALEAFQTKLQAGDLEGAIADLEALVERPDAPATARGILGGLYVETGRMEHALGLLRPLAESPDANPAVLYNLGRAARATGEIELAVSSFERAAQAAPVSPASRELGLIRGLQGRYAEAYALLFPWIRDNPDDVDARLAAAAGALQLERASDAELLLSDLAQDDPRVRLLWGRLLLLREDPWGAIGYLKPLVDEAPTGMEREVRRILSRAYMLVGESAEAVTLLQGTVGNDPTLALQLARAQFQSGEIEAALATLQPFAEEVMRNEEGRAQLDGWLVADLTFEHGRLLVGAGRSEDAIPFLRLATEADPSSKVTWQTLGQALAASGDRAEAEKALARFQELAEQEQEVSINQRERDLEDPTGKKLREALTMLDQGRGEEALRMVRSEGELAPDDPRPPILEARVLLLLGRAAEAEATARRAVALSSENPDAHYVLGTVLMARRQLGEARSELEAALQIAPEHTPAMNDLAVLLVEQGETEEARALLERILELRPDDPVAKDNLERLEAKGR
ncbi:MAG TPA: tetratricopeptide repeat protein [Thermoanaerobaculia bacterium]|nr:tetratricopeptide repeat protein [Thermoanaerobaculia bacterium]